MVATKLRVLIVEDSAFTRMGLRNYLEKQEFSVDEASNIADGMKLMEQNKPDVAILDISVPNNPGEQPAADGKEGLHLARQIKQKYPSIGVILLSGYLSYYPEFLELSKMYQGVAYLFKGENPRNELLEVIDQVCNGGIWVAPQVAGYKVDAVSVPLSAKEQDIVRQLVRSFNELSSREKEIVRQVALSHNNEEIARELNISLNTVSAHLTNIYTKLGLADGFLKSYKRILLAKAYLYKQNSDW